MARNGKIARLPRELREELNRRMAENEPGETLLKWLNGLPAMRSILDGDFGGKPVSKQNLCEWRARGFAEWQARREILGSPDELAAEAAEGKLTAHLATVLAGRYAALVAGWNGEVDEAIRFKLKVLHGLCRDVAVLRQGEIREARKELAERRKGNPRSEAPKSERRPKTEIRKAGGEEAQMARADGKHFEDENENEEDSLRRSGDKMDEVGQGESNQKERTENRANPETDSLRRPGAVKVGQSGSNLVKVKMTNEEGGARNLNPTRNPKSWGRGDTEELNRMDGMDGMAPCIPHSGFRNSYFIWGGTGDRRFGFRDVPLWRCW
jgi:hypothetical protein